MPSFNDSIVVPFGLAELAGASSAVGVLAYADGQYLPAMSAMPVSQHAFFATSTTCSCRVSNAPNIRRKSPGGGCEVRGTAPCSRIAA